MELRNMKLLVNKGVKFQKMCEEARQKEEKKKYIFERFKFVFGEEMANHFWLEFKYDLDAESFVWSLDHKNSALFVEKF